MKYSIVIPTYNHCDDLLKPCVDSILQFTDMNNVELIISANGCVDNTKWYLRQLEYQFQSLGFGDNFRSVWSDSPLGYSGACNAGIQAARSSHIVLLNNDCILLKQPRSQWLNLLNKPFVENSKCGISCVIKGPSECAGHDFAVFFCVMISRTCFDTVGLLNTEYNPGGGEDTEFCIEAERAGFQVIPCIDLEWIESVQWYSGEFPIYHKGEGTVHDPMLVPDWSNVFVRNSLKLAKKYNPIYYQNWIRMHGTPDII